MGSKCKLYIVYLYLMGIMIINRSGMGVQMFFSIYRLLILVHVYNFVFQGPRDISGGCRCGVNGEACHPGCSNCH